MTPTEYQRAVATLRRQCPTLRAVDDSFGPPSPNRRPAGLDTLVRIILEQQISVKAADAIHKRLTRGLGRLSARALVDAGEDGLRALGLTRQKAHYCVELGHAIRARRFSVTGIARRSDADALAALVDLKGIGPWSASIYLMMALGRTDIWPPGDLALDRAVRQLLGDPSIDPAATADRWSPYRTVAADYLWHYYRKTRSLSENLI
ncbi:MAG: DNA-3-methyladenine glycosylase 2 family protein [Pseudomonadota bacterium]